MKKKFFQKMVAVLTATVCILTNGALAATLPENSTSGLGDQNFNNPDVNKKILVSNWTNGNFWLQRVVAMTETDGDNTYARMIDVTGSWGRADAVINATNLTASDTLKLSFKYNNGDNSDRSIRCNDYGSSDLVNFNSDGTVTLCGGVNPMTYVPGKWFTVDLYIHGQSQFFSVVLTDEDGNKQHALGYQSEKFGQYSSLQFRNHTSKTPWYVDDINVKIMSTMDALDEAKTSTQDFSNIDGTLNVTNIRGADQFLVGGTKETLKIEKATGVCGKDAQDVSLHAYYTGTSLSNNVWQWIAMGDSTVSKIYSFDFCNNDNKVSKNFQFKIGSTKKFIYFSPNGEITFSNNANGAVNDGTAAQKWPLLQNYDIGKWYHIDLLMDTDYNIDIYIDGVLKGSFKTDNIGDFGGTAFNFNGGQDMSFYLDNTYFNIGKKEDLLAKIKTTETSVEEK